MRLRTKQVLISLSLLLGAWALSACEAENRANDGDSTLGSDSTSTTHGTGPEQGSDSETDFAPSTDPLSGCAEGTEKIYLIDSNQDFYSFDPSVAGAGAFARISTLNCTNQATPHSMAISRDGYAYVLYSVNSNSCFGLYKVEIKTGKCLGKTPFKCSNAANFTLFGMGYATDAAGGSDETLYIGRSRTDPALGILDVETGDVAELGPLPATGPEFTGNGQGELWGFFPEANQPSVIQINKSNGAGLQTLAMPGLPKPGTGNTAWAFANWGGSFYVFYMSASDKSTNVWKLDADGTLTTPWRGTGKTIVGAGVSTCAPSGAR